MVGLTDFSSRMNVQWTFKGRNRNGWDCINNQKPKYRTIAAFRHDNYASFIKLFDHFRNFCMQLGLYGRQTVAIDGSKFRAQNSKKNNYNSKNIKFHQQYIQQKTEEYLAELDANDGKRKKKLTKEQQEKLDNLSERKKKYDELAK